MPALEALARVVAMFGVARAHHTHCGILAAMSTASLDHLDAQQLRAMAERLMDEVAARDAQIVKRDQVLRFKQTHIGQLMQEVGCTSAGATASAASS